MESSMGGNIDMKYLKGYKLFLSEGLNFPMDEDLQEAIKKILGEHVTAPDVYRSDLKTWQDLEWDNKPFIAHVPDDLKNDFDNRDSAQIKFDHLVNLINDYGNSQPIEIGMSWNMCQMRFTEKCKNPVKGIFCY